MQRYLEIGIKQIGSNLPKILNDVLSYVVPELCFGCNAVLYRGEQLLCAFCRNELPLTEFHAGVENPADRLFYGRCPVERTEALFFYLENGIVQNLIHNLKYHGQERIGLWLGHWMGLQLVRKPDFQEIHYVIPVPLHPDRERKRGYNQCRAFGKAIASHLGAVYSERNLIKRYGSRTQTTKSRWKRWKGTSGTFILKGKEDLEGKNILIIDDVLTTGATVEACIQAMEPVIEKRIYVAVMAVVP